MNASQDREHRDARVRTEAQAQLAAIVESSDDAIVGKDVDGIIQNWNAGAERIFGWTADEVIGKPITVIIPADRLHEEPEILRRIRAGERVDHFETVRQRKDGTLVHISVTVSPIREKDGRVIGASKIARDISARRRAEALASEDAKVVEAINQIGHAVAAELDVDRLVQAVTDVTTALVGAEFGSFFYNVVNEGGESYVLYTLSGVDRSKFEQFPMPRNTEIFGPTFRGEGVVRLDDVTKDPRFGRNPPYHGMPPGHLPVRSYLAVPVVSRSGEVLGGLFYGHSRVGVFTERHERIVTGVAAPTAVAIDNARLLEAARRASAEKDKLLESERAARAEAERASRLKDDFLATLSHELRTPLNAILGWSQVVRSAASDSGAAAEIAEGAATIERNARAQAQIIEDLLDMSRIISGKLRLDVQRVDLIEVVRAAVETVRPAAEAKGVRLQPVLDPAVGTVSGDPHRLHQVFWNLLTNAVKFTPRGGRVQVLLERVNSHVEVSVVDTGEGIKPEFLPHVFDRFRQADASTTRRHGGLGIGLAIVKQLVEMHGGSVRVKSGGQGQGATFTVDLPLVVMHPAQDPGADAVRRHPRGSGIGSDASVSAACIGLEGVKVLVVDDEVDARELVRRLLEECDAEVLTASSAADAIAALESFRPDAIVSDIGMPEEDGYSFIRKVRSMAAERGGRVPAVALTAYARSEDRMRALAAGFQMHVVKPVEPAELVMVVASVAGRVMP